MTGTEVPSVAAALHHVRMPDVAFSIGDVLALDPDIGLAVRRLVVSLFINVAVPRCRYYLDAFRRRSHPDFYVDHLGGSNAGNPERTCSECQRGDQGLRLHVISFAK